ncbi:unnamed protein product [Spirodela intermedia]|uniref:Uncharacterized protein n=1 Tax=Spirodela intermedia TaxID=51605 RepID=A0ABN7EEE4_SPIIN|nr:unnamed protein product [Spirodela intermedia]
MLSGRDSSPDRSFSSRRCPARLDTCSTPRFTLADLQVGPGLRALSFCVGRCRGMRRGGEQQQHNSIFGLFPL